MSFSTDAQVAQTALSYADGSLPPMPGDIFVLDGAIRSLPGPAMPGTMALASPSMSDCRFSLPPSAITDCGWRSASSSSSVPPGRSPSCRG
ncbi:MAG: hypothetical protein R3E09_11325 [Novosphingobium sp.]